MSVLVGADLDQTLIYSRAAVLAHGDSGRELVPVEIYDGADASWMTARSAQLLIELLAGGTLVVPVTTRTPAQWRRITLPGPAPRYAIAANGGVLLVEGEPDSDWDAVVARNVDLVASLTEVRAQAEQVCATEWTRALRTAHGLFCYAVLDRDLLPDGVLEQTTEWARSRGWRVSLQGRKLYWVPETLSKSAALAEVARRVDAHSVLAAGDSLLDADLLAAADRAIMARHGELAASGWTAPHVEVTQSTGVLAGEQILEWLRAEVGALA